MPCTFTVEIEVTDKEAAEAALKALGWDGAQLRQRGKKWVLTASSPGQEAQFRTAYAVEFAKREARKKMFRLGKQTEDAENVYLRFDI